MSDRLSASAVGMMAAEILRGLMAESREAFEDIFDRRGYIVQGKSYAQLRCEAAAVVACDLAQAVEAELESRHKHKHESTPTKGK